MSRYPNARLRDDKASSQTYGADFYGDDDDPLSAISAGGQGVLVIDGQGRILQRVLSDFYDDDEDAVELSIVADSGHSLFRFGADGRLLIDVDPAPLADTAAPAMIPYITGTELRAVGATDELAADLGGYEAITIAPGNERSVRAVIDRPSIGLSTTVSAANGLMIPDYAATLHVIIVLGQSLAVGANAYQTLVMVQPVWPDDALMMEATGHSDVRLGMQTASGTPMPPADPARWIGFEPLVARASATGNMGQTVAESCATALAQSARDIGIRFRTLSFVAGVGGTTYAGLKKGSQIYANMLIALEKAKALAEERGWRLVVDGCLVKHGESDSANASYQANLIEWQADIDADVKAITGQQAPVHLIMAQPSTSLNASFASPLAMLAVHNSSPVHHLAGADYPFGDFYDTDLLHFLGPGYHLIGEQMARACRQVLWTAAGKSKIVQIIAATRTGTSVVLDYEVPVPPLVFDTTSHTELDVKGFRFVDSTGDIAITDAALTGQAQVTLTLASEPTGTGAYVGYAVRPQTSPRTVEARPRGNLRDSSAELSTYLDRPLYNWAVHQRFYL